MTLNDTTNPPEKRRTWLKVVGALFLPPLGFWFLRRSPRTKAVKVISTVVLAFYSIIWLAVILGPKHPVSPATSPAAATASPSISATAPATPAVSPTPTPTTVSPTPAPTTAAPITAPTTAAPVTPSSNPPVYTSPSADPTTAAPVYTDPPAPAPTTHQAAGCTTDSKGNCIVRGRYCPNSAHGGTGTDANGSVLTCEDNNGWRWE